MLEVQKERIRDAEAALEKSDLHSLKRLYDKAEKDLDAIVAGMCVMTERNHTQPRESENTINAMRDVALAAIELAKLVSLHGPVVLEQK